MTDGPQECALPGCGEAVEQPQDGGPRRLYCSPAHRASARKMRHAARMQTTEPTPEPAASTPEQTAAIQADPTVPVVAATAAEPVTEEVVAESAPTEPVSTEPATEPAAASDPVTEEVSAPDHTWSPAAAWTTPLQRKPVQKPTLPPVHAGRTVRTITSRRVKQAKTTRTTAERKAAATSMRRRAVASLAVASLIAGGTSYYITENIAGTPTVPPPQGTPQPAMEADVWA
ncbi:MAG: hypothetical protein ACRDQ0_09050, partial [Pseudonocardia sp.]